MGASWITPEMLVLVAGGFHALGYLVLNQVILRLFLFVGTVFYVGYYWTVAPQPLWAAISTSMILGGANLIGLSILIAQRSRLAVPRAHKDIYERFHDMPPGDFRALVSAATRQILSKTEQVTVEGAAVAKLYYVIHGRMQIEKRDARFAMPAGVFVGEVAYLTQRASSASTWIDAGSEVLVWDVQKLRRIAGRKPRFKLALEAMISRDLANKVAFAVAPVDLDLAEKEARAMLA